MNALSTKIKGFGEDAEIVSLDGGDVGSTKDFDIENGGSISPPEMQKFFSYDNIKDKNNEWNTTPIKTNKNMWNINKIPLIYIF